MTFDRRISEPGSAAGRRIRRQVKQKSQNIKAVVGVGDNSSPFVDNGKLWVRRTTTKDANGNFLYGVPEKVNVGWANYWPDNGTRVFIGKDPDGNWEVTRGDSTDAKAKNKNPAILNSGVKQNKYFRLKNATRLICRPVGGNPTGSTLVGVRGLIYDDNYYESSRFKATGVISSKLDLASYIPTAGNEAVVVVFLDTLNNTLAAGSSTAQAIGTGIDFTDYQEAIADDRWNDYIPIQAFHLADAQTSIDNTHLGEDLRQFINMPDAAGLEYELTVNTRIRDKRQYLISGELEIPLGKTLEIELGGELAIISGSPKRSELIVTTTYTMDIADDFILADTSGGAFTITLPVLADAKGFTYNVSNRGVNTLTLDGDGSDTINGELTQGLDQYDDMELFAASTEWIIL